jgi:hypothetical protein
MMKIDINDKDDVLINSARELLLPVIKKKT